MSSVHLNQCLQALNVMYDQPSVDQDTRAQANAYLANLQSQPYIWEVADQILCMNNLSQPYYFYAANALFYRLKKKFTELPSTEIRLSFRQSLMNHLNRFLNPESVSSLLGNGKSVNITERLCSCLSVLVAQMVASGEWSTALIDLTNMLNTPATVVMLLDVLQYIPEMTAVQKVDLVKGSEGIDILKKELSHFHPQFLALLLSVLNSTQDSHVHKRAFAALSSWATNRCFHLQDVYKHDIFGALLSGVSMGPLTSMSCQTLCALLAAFKSIDRDNDIQTQQLVEHVTEKVLSLLPLLDGFVNSNSIDSIKSLANVVVDLATAFIPFITRVQQHEYIFASAERGDVLGVCTVNNDVGLAIIDAVVRLMQGVVIKTNDTNISGNNNLVAGNAVDKIDPYELSDVILNTFRLWYDIDSEFRYIYGVLEEENIELSRRIYNLGDLVSPQIEAEKVAVELKYKAFERRMAELSPLLERGLVSLCYALRLPVGYNNLDVDERDECKQRRHRIDECLTDIASILSPERAFTVICQNLQIEYNTYAQYLNMNKGEVMSEGSSQWQSMEAFIQAIRIMCRIVTRRLRRSNDSYNTYDANTSNDVNTVLVPQVIELILSLQGNSHIRYTKILTLGRYADHFTSRPQLLPAVFECIVSDLNCTTVSHAASRAFKDICEACSGVVAEQYLDQVLNVYEGIANLAYSEQLEITEGVTYIIGKLPNEVFTPSLQRVIVPIANMMQAAVESGDVNSAPSQVLLVYLQRLIIIIDKLRYRGSPDPVYVITSVVNVVESLSTLLLAVINMYGAEDRRVDRACQCWKYVLRAAGTHSQKLVPSICTALCDSFTKTQQSVFIYVASTIVSTFPPPSSPSSSPSQLCFDPLDVAVKFWNFFVPAVLSFCQATPDACERFPELCEDMVGLVLVYADYAPQLLANSPLLPQVIPLLTSFLHSSHQHLYTTTASTLSALYALVYSNYHTYESTQLNQLLVSTHAHVLNTVFNTLDCNRRSIATLKCIPTIIDIMKFTDRANNTNPDYSREIVQSALSQESLQSVNSVVKSDLLLALIDAKIYDSKDAIHYCKQVCREVIRQIKGDDEDDEERN